MKKVQKAIRCWAIVVFVLVCLGTGSAWATTIIAHQGLNNPHTEGWSGGNGKGGTEVTASGSHDYWEMKSNTNTSYHRYEYSLNTLDFLSYNWSLETSIRVTDSPRLSMGFFVSDGFNLWGLQLSNNQANLVKDYYSKTSVDFSDYNTFRIQFSKNGVGIEDDTADFFINDVLVFDDLGRNEVFRYSGNIVISMNTGGDHTQGTARYEYLHFDLEPSTNTIPEPTTMLLFGMGLLGLAGMNRKRLNIGTNTDDTGQKTNI